MVDFAPGASFWRTRPNTSYLTSGWYRHLANSSKHDILFDSARWSHGMKTWRHPQSRKYITCCNVVRGGSSHGHRQHARKFGEVRPRGFRVMRVDRQTDRQRNKQTNKQTDRQTYSLQYFAFLLGRNNRVHCANFVRSFIYWIVVTLYHYYCNVFWGEGEVGVTVSVCKLA